MGGWFLGDGIACGDDPDHDGFVGCADGCPLDFNKHAPGHCGCGVLDVDSDADGVLDCNDACPGTIPAGPVNTCGCFEKGACCFPIGVCFEGVWADNCGTIGGHYQGDGTACAM